MERYLFLVAPLAGWLVAQAIKFILVLHKNGFQWRDFVSSGGMPSSHTSSIVALSTTIGLSYGFDSAAFALAATISAIVMYDAFGVRRTVGEQTVYLRVLGENNPAAKKLTIHDAEGHTPEQVFWGAVAGVAIGLLVYQILVVK